MNKIILHNLKASCIIGVKPDERHAPQNIVVDLELYMDLSKPAESDDIKDTIDYDELARDVTEYIETTSFRLLEKLAYEIAKLAKGVSRAEKVSVLVKKPGALEKAEYAAVEISV